MIGKKTVAGAGAASALAIAISLAATWEGLSLKAYPDIVGVWTICRGETLGVKPGQTATLAECDAKLLARIDQFEREIRPCLPMALPNKTRGAFVSAAYNIGSAGFCKSSMSSRALAGNLRGACDALMMWVKAGGKTVQGLVNRREHERKVCLEGLA